MPRPADLHTRRLRLISLLPAEAEAILNTGLPLADDDTDTASLRDIQAGRGWPHADTADALGMHAEHGAPGPYACWLVVLDHTVIGDVGCHGGPDAAGAVEIGYGIAAPYRNQGHATEAVAALISMLTQQPEVRTVRATTEVGNEPSQRLLLRLGFIQGTPDPHPGGPVQTTPVLHFRLP